MKIGINQIKIGILVVLLLPLIAILITERNSLNIYTFFESKNSLATYEVWDKFGDIHPDGPFTIEEFNQIVDNEIWFGYETTKDIPKDLRISDKLTIEVLDYIENHENFYNSVQKSNKPLFSDLIQKGNRRETLNNLDSQFRKSNVRNYILKLLAQVFWSFQKESEYIPISVLNSEIFYGKEGWIYNKALSTCKNAKVHNDFNRIIYELNNIGKEIIIMPIPLKGQIVKDNLLPFQEKFITCENIKALNNQIEVASKEYKLVKYINLYELYTNEENSEIIYTQGNTHWSDYGLSLAILELISTIDPESINSISTAGTKMSNNEVIKRLGLIDLVTYENVYKISTTAILNNKEILLIRDSFFDLENGGYKLRELLEYDEIHWSYVERISPEIFNKILSNYSVVIIQSSIENLLYFNPYGEIRLHKIAEQVSTDS